MHKTMENVKTCELIKLIVTFILCCINTIESKCPPSEVVNPCKCSVDKISCGGNEYYDLYKYFQTLSGSISNENEKHFKTFYLTNTAIKELDMNVFYDITFDALWIDNCFNLTKINGYADTAINNLLTEFKIWNSPCDNLTGGNNIFNALNAMENAEWIQLYNTSITTLPSNAFHDLPKLKKLILDHNSKLKTIGNNAFSELNSLEAITVDVNIVSAIPDNAFNLPHKRSQTLSIYLNEMPYMSSNSFSSQTFANIKPPFILYLNNNTALKYLDEAIFSPVLAKGNKIDLKLTPLECDCRMYWIFKNTNYDDNIVINAQCSGTGKSLFSSRDKFLNCTL